MSGASFRSQGESSRDAAFRVEQDRAPHRLGYFSELHSRIPFRYSPAMRRLLTASVISLCCLVSAGSAQEVKVASYNVENYLGPAPENQPPGRRARPKSEEAAGAIVAIVKEIDPDILGVCEMGTAEQFAAFQQRLADAGVGYKDSEFVNGPDPDRHLALLSRFPIVARNSRPDISYDLNGIPEKVKRGFLDVTIRVSAEYELRLVGVHLKSKLETSSGEALVRRHEAQLLAAFGKNPDRRAGDEPAVVRRFQRPEERAGRPGDHGSTRESDAALRSLVAR